MTNTGRGFLDFAGRSVVVTGASSGLGRACAEELAHHGARVVLIGRNVERLGEVRAGMAGDGHEVLVLDLNELDRISPEIVRISGVVGRIYGFCHAAGIVDTRPLGVTTADTVQRLMTVNVYAGLELAKAIVRRDVMDPEGGSLVFLSSIYGNVGVPGEIGYSATKGAIAAAVRAMAIELARRRVRVNTVSPGLVMTPMTDSALGDLTPEQVAAIEQKHPLGLGTPADVARAALFLLAPATSWITGTELIVDGGYSAQ